jgi:hypothetical protein
VSANRYMIKVFDSYGQKSLTFKLKTIVGNKEEFIKEIMEYIDWEQKLNTLEQQESQGCNGCGHKICMCDQQ